MVHQTKYKEKIFSNQNTSLKMSPEEVRVKKLKKRGHCRSVTKLIDQLMDNLEEKSPNVLS